MIRLYKLLVCLVLISNFKINADTPANCMIYDLHGTWNVSIYSGGHSSSLKCKNPGKVRKTVTITFSGRNTAVLDQTGAEGTFSLVYNEGFETVINYQKFFAFFAWERKDKHHSRYWCDRTMMGWVHDVLGNDWACFKAIKKKSSTDLIDDFDEGVVVENDNINENLMNEQFDYDDSIVEEINSIQNSWVAGDNPELKSMTLKQVLMRSGYANKKGVRTILPNGNLGSESSTRTSDLPESIDWRNYDGQNFVTPPRNQGNCGSCYVFAALEMLESRIRIMTNNTQQPIFSPQDVVSCSKYSQGCQGGFPFLIAGKYAQDFGVIEESCYPYLAHNTKHCSPVKSCRRTHVAGYEYVGGYYGAGNEENMMRALVDYGPLVVSIECPLDFHFYTGGIYHKVFGSDSTSSKSFDPFEKTNHAILLVGYGVDSATGEKYWIIKNSWGKIWGENGFGKFRRGIDEVAIESMPMQSWPIPHL